MNLVEVELPNDGIAVIRLQRQSRRNALSVALVRELLDALQAPGADRRVRVIILTGEGAAFCAGGDLTDESTLEAARDGIVGSVDLQQLFSTMPLRLRSIEQPVIAAINGPAAGAGLALALAADLRVAGASAMLHVASIKIGLSGGECGLSWHLPRLVGTGRALELLLTGRPVAAEEAERLGLVNRVVPDDELLDAAIALAHEIAANSPFALRGTKQVTWAGVDLPLAAALRLENSLQVAASMTEDGAEAMSAYREKRPPRFTSR
ncbi:MAG TPA: enoyl-CoA hydratase-related protein [Mycobacterium sp.]|jgi:enoyl-CoA hydratase|uniref:enoyl-CoA hydratase/isomerase family protein n=1 Tax=Mycobacterium sp. TaxID=1785 RepID=UPI002F412338